MIDIRYIELKKGNMSIPFHKFTTDFQQDVHILIKEAASTLDKSVPFDSKRYKISQYNEETIVITSKKKKYLLQLDNIYTYDAIMGIDYRFFLFKDK